MEARLKLLSQARRWKAFAEFREPTDALQLSRVGTAQIRNSQP